MRLLAAAAYSLLLSTSALAENIYLTGSETVAAFLAEHQEDFESTYSHKLHIDKTGSSNGYKHVNEGGAFLGMASRPPKPVEKKKGLKLHKIGDDAAVFITHFYNKTRDITLDQLRDLYSGNESNWQSVNTDMDQPVALFGPQTHHGTFSMVTKRLGLQTEHIKHVSKLAKYHRRTLKQVAIKPGSLGFISLAAWEKQIAHYASRVNILEIDGVEPTRANVDNGSYSFRQPLYIVANRTLTQAEKALVDFVKGQAHNH